MHNLGTRLFEHRFYHVTNVIQASELVEADGQVPQSCQTGNLLHLTQTVAMKVQHLQAQ